MNQENALHAPLYSEAQTRRWLSWLARGTTQHGQTVFLIEHLQPSWLATRSQRWIYYLASRTTWGLLLGLILGLITLTIGLYFNPDPIFYVGAALAVALPVSLLYGAIVGLSDMMRLHWRRRRKNKQAGPSHLQFVGDFLLVAFIVGLLSWLLNPTGDYGYIYALNYGLIIGLIGGPIKTIHGTRRQADNEIQTVETLSWSWPKARKSGFVGLLAGFILGFVGGFVGGLPLSPETGLAGGLICGLVGGLLVGLVSGVSGGINPALQEMKTRPNQGIWVSTRNALIVGSCTGLIIGLASGAVYASPIVGVAYGTLVGSCFGLWYGGLDVLQHGILRLLFYCHGDTPLNYARFLDYAAEDLNFLQKVGGGYIFVHRYLLEYFAAMDEGSDAGE